MSNNKTKLLLIVSLILVSLLFNKPSSAFFDFEDTGNVNHDSALAFRPPPDPSRNNTDIQSTTASPVYKTNSSSSNVSALVNNATSLYDLGNYTQAMHYYDKALAIDPKDKYALDGKGIALRREGNYTQAIHLFEKALAIDPKDKYALNGKGNALYSQG